MEYSMPPREFDTVQRATLKRYENRERENITPQLTAEIKRLWGLGVAMKEIRGIYPKLTPDEIVAIIKGQ